MERPDRRGDHPACGDPEGRSIRLHDAQWIHHILAERAELLGQVSAVEEAITAPDLIHRDAVRADRIRYYRRGAIRRFSRFYPKVCAQVLPPDANGSTNGEVVSAYLVSKPKRGEVKVGP